MLPRGLWELEADMQGGAESKQGQVPALGTNFPRHLPATLWESSQAARRGLGSG